jgi:hypothetical protein
MLAGASGTGLAVGSVSGSNTLSGSVVLTLQNAASFRWVSNGNLSLEIGGGSVYSSAGLKATSAALDRLRLTTTTGVPIFDNGSVSLSYD